MKSSHFIEQEHQTMQLMLTMYCKAHHDYNGALCNICEEVSQYSYARLQSCPFKESKPTCGNCTVHFYKTQMRDRVKRVMRYAGPRMLFIHPIKAIQHLIQSKRQPPKIRNKKKNGLG